MWLGDTTGIANVNAEYTTITIQPVDATITATYFTLPTYTLTVVSGSGDGVYVAGKLVTVSADSPPAGKAFYQWVGDTGGISNTFGEVTTITMPAAAAAITATYQNAIEISAPGTLTVAGGYYRLTQDVSAGGTAFIISANDITLDLGGHTVTYNTTAGNSQYGVLITLGMDRVTVKNGILIQGAGGGAGCHGISMAPASWCYGPYELHHLVIYTHGDDSAGISVRDFSNSSIHHNYIRCDANTLATDGGGALCISVNAQREGNLDIYENIAVNGHRGLHLTYLGLDTSNPAQSNVYNNLIQHSRRMQGSKAPYGILMAKSRNVHVNANQIISDKGRGIILDGYGQGVPRGTDFCQIYDNRIDVQYSDVVTSGPYPENRVYGIRDRYSSGNNTFDNNILMVQNDVPAAGAGTRRTDAFSIGSDGYDGLMVNFLVQNNTIFAREGVPGATITVFSFSRTESATVIDNNYQSDGGIFSGTGNVLSFTESNNNVFNPTPTSPAAPTGLRLTKFLNDYLLQWDDNTEADVYEYVVYRDGSPLPISTRGGMFYVDRDVTGSHTYSVSALTVSGTEGPQCAPVSTTTAGDAWW